MKFVRHVLMISALVLVPSAYAKGAGAEINGGGSDGCGLGWQITDKKTLIATTTRGSTNGFVPPAFGMTSGTIGCESHSFAMNEQSGKVYARNNFEALSSEMAVGSGETLATYARTFGCSDAAVPAFGSALKANYESLTAKGAADLNDGVSAVVASDPVLRNACGA